MKGKAQYPFGYGLTYGKAEVRSVEVVETETGANVFVKVENTGERDICEVLQIYIKCENSIYAVPNPQLCGFCRVKLYNEERKTFRYIFLGKHLLLWMKKDVILQGESIIQSMPVSLSLMRKARNLRV